MKTETERKYERHDLIVPVRFKVLDQSQFPYRFKNGLLEGRKFLFTSEQSHHLETVILVRMSDYQHQPASLAGVVTEMQKRTDHRFDTIMKVASMQFEDSSTADTTTVSEMVVPVGDGEYNQYAPDDFDQDGICSNMSGSGILLQTAKRLSLDDTILIRTSIPLKKKVPILALGKLIWHKPDGDAFLQGIVFNWVIRI